MTREEAIEILKTDGCYGCAVEQDSPYNCSNGGCEIREAYYMAIEALEQPAADVVEVVRCKDCKLFEQNGKKEFGNCPHHQCLAYLTDFCSWGERKEDEQIH